MSSWKTISKRNMFASWLASCAVLANSHASANEAFPIQNAEDARAAVTAGDTSAPGDTASLHRLIRFRSDGSDMPRSSHVVAFLAQDPVRPATDTSQLNEPAQEEAREVSEQVENDRLGGESIFGGDVLRSPAVEKGRFELPPLMIATTEMSAIGNGRRPEGFREGAPSVTRPIPEAAFEREAHWSWTVREWAAPNTFSHPRYFEDRMLERHGHERFPYLQPIASGARFFTAATMLPYLMAVRHPCDCEYTLGYFRPGSCVPPYLQRPPYERRAVAAQAAAVATRAAVILP